MSLVKSLKFTKFIKIAVNPLCTHARRREATADFADFAEQDGLLFHGFYPASLYLRMLAVLYAGLLQPARAFRTHLQPLLGRHPGWHRC